MIILLVIQPEMLRWGTDATGTVRVADRASGPGPPDRHRTREDRPYGHGAARLPHRTADPLRPPQLRLPRRPAPLRRHGPYWQWTRKVAAKTICRWLSPEQQHDYQAWFSNDRRLRELIGQLETLGAAALEADPRLHRHGRSHPTGPADHSRDVGTARLTCGQAPETRRMPSSSLKVNTSPSSEPDCDLVNSRS